MNPRLILTLAVLAPPCLAAPLVHTTPHTTTITSTLPSHASDSRLTEAEWARYETLMKGPRGRWSPNMDPVSVLGNHATSDAERRRYAELAAQLTHDRVDGEVKFALAYQAAWNRLYGDPGSAAAVTSGTRIALFVADQCAACDQQVQHYLAALDADRIPGLDLYLLGTTQDDDVRAWALARQIPAGPVLQRRLTLNHGDAVLKTLGYRADQLPLVLQRDRRNQLVLLNGGLP